MKIRSLTEVASQYIPIDVEVRLIPGLPQVHFLGGADPRLKESSLRLKSAFRACGLKFPKAQQVVVNLTPSHIKKISPGVELAVAVAILKLTGQGPDWDPSQYVIFGELSLAGEVQFPQVSKLFDSSPTLSLLSGVGMESHASGFQVLTLSELSSLKAVQKSKVLNLQKPVSPVTRLTRSQAEALLVAAVGGHHVLLAGAQGSGKTLMAEVLHYLQEPPDAELLGWHEALFQKTLSWVPMARPHHTITPQSMVGGGVPPRPGEITRAHGGILFLDEMMEFKPSTLEVLREALSSEQVTISRGLQSSVFQSRFQLVGATNLCPCGKWTPGKVRNCDYNEKRCKSILQKLSGPLMDRIQGVLYFSDRMEKPEVPLEVLQEQVLAARKFQRDQGRVSNRDFKEVHLTPAEFRLWSEILETLEIPSVRRRQGCVAWARTLADHEERPAITREIFLRAYEQTVLGFERLMRSTC